MVMRMRFIAGAARGAISMGMAGQEVSRRGWSLRESRNP